MTNSRRLIVSIAALIIIVIINTGCQPHEKEGPSPIIKKQIYQIKDSISKPIIGRDGALYAGSTNGVFYALNIDGTKKWSFNAGKDSWPTAITIRDDGAIYVNSGIDKLYIVSSSGRLLESIKIKPWKTNYSAIAKDGTIYVVDDNDCSNIHALSRDGSKKWDFKASEAIDSNLVLGKDGTIYFACFEDKLYALKPDGSLKWMFRVLHDDDSMPVIAKDGTIYFASDDGDIYALKPDGTKKWMSEAVGDGMTPSLAKDGTIYSTRNDKLNAIRQNGTVKWSIKTKETYNQGQPVVSENGTIYFYNSGEDVTWLYSVRPNGTVKWIAKVDIFAPLNSPIIGNDGIIYVYDELKSNLSAFRER